MKAYLLFAGIKNIPNGGMYDFKGFFDSVDEAINFFEYGEYHEWNGVRLFDDWYHVVQTSDMSVISSGWREE